MKKVTVSDWSNHKMWIVPDEIASVLYSLGGPVQVIQDAITYYLESKNIEIGRKPTRRATILLFLKENNIITTKIALRKHLINQAVQLHEAVRILMREGEDIGCIDDSRPFIYYFGITRDEANRKAPRVFHPNRATLRRIENEQDRIDSIVNRGQKLVNVGLGLEVVNLRADRIQPELDRQLQILRDGIPYSKHFTDDELVEACKNRRLKTMFFDQQPEE